MQTHARQLRSSGKKHRGKHMSEKMMPMPFEKLVKWMLGEQKAKGSVFGIHKCKFSYMK